MDEELSSNSGKDELATMKRNNPPNKAPLFKLLGDITNGNPGNPNEQTPDQMMLDSIGCTANVIMIDP